MVVAMARYSKLSDYILGGEPTRSQVRGRIEEKARRNGSNPLSAECEPEVIINKDSHPRPYYGRENANPYRNPDRLLADEPARWEGEYKAQYHKGGSEEVDDRCTLSVQLELWTYLPYASKWRLAQLSRSRSLRCWKPASKTQE